MTTSATVTQYFNNVLQRDPSASELSSFVAIIDSGALTTAQVLESIVQSTEGQTYAAQVIRFYQAAFGRVPDVTGINGWVDDILAGTTTTTDLAVGFVLSAEWTARYGTSDVTSASLQALYQNVLGRTASGAEIDAWIATGQSMDQILIGFANSQEFQNNATAGVNSLLTTAGNTATASIATVYDGVSPLDTNANVGTTFTLTTAADNIVGTSANDTIDGVSAATAAAATDTLTVADKIDGGGGNDTLNVTTTATNTDVTDGAAISNIETVNIRATGGTASLDASSISGLTAVNANISAGNVVVTNLATGASAGMTGNGTITNGNLNLGYATGADAATVNISGGTKAGAVTITTAPTAVTVNSTGTAANTIGAVALGGAATGLTVNANANLTTGNVTGFAGTSAAITVAGTATAVALGTIENATVKTVDASGLTQGGLTATLSTNTSLTVTGGTGADVLTTGVALATGSVNAGAGTDTLVLANVAHANTASLAGKYTNFETLSVNGTFDASLISGITSIILSGAVNNISKLSATQAAAITASVDIGNTTLALSDATGTSDALTLMLGNGKGVAADAGALTVNGFETLNIKANGLSTNADKTSVIASFVADKATAINLTGTAVNLTNAATTLAATIDASALTGDGAATPVGLTLAGTLVEGSTVTGSGLKDTITLGTVGSTYNTGAGDDAISGTAAQLNTGAKYNTIDGGAGTDTLTISDGAGTAITLVDNNLSKLTSVEKIVITDTTTGAQSITTGGFFDTNFKTDGVDLTTTASGVGGNVVIDMNTFSGAATLTSTTGAGTQTITTGTSGGADKVTVTSTTGNVTVSTGAGADTVAVTTGAATNVVTTGAGDDTITMTGGATANTVTGGAGADTITLGAATIDTVVVGNTDSGITVATADTIKSGFATTTDKLKLGLNGDATAGTGNYVETGTAVADFAAALTAANVALNGLNGTSAATELYALQHDATNAYLFVDTDSNGSADQVIILTGLNDTTFAAGDIIA